MPKSKKNNKSGQPSTASQGKPSSRSTAFDGDSDSSVSFVEDVYDSYEPPKTRGSKGAKASKHKSGMKAQDFLKNPNSNFLAVKIKQEPVSPKAGDSMAARNPQGVSGSHAATTSASTSALPFEDKDGVYSSMINYVNSHPTGETAGADPGSQMAAKSGTTATPETPGLAPPTSGAAPSMDPPSTPSRPPSGGPVTSTPGRTPTKPPAKAKTPTKESPRRSPRNKKDVFNSPGKASIENRAAQFSGLARKKASQPPITEEPEPYEDSDEDSAVGGGRDLMDGSDSYGSNKPYFRAPYPDDYAAYRKGLTQTPGSAWPRKTERLLENLSTSNVSFNETNPNHEDIVF